MCNFFSHFNLLSQFHRSIIFPTNFYFYFFFSFKLFSRTFLEWGKKTSSPTKVSNYSEIYCVYTKTSRLVALMIFFFLFSPLRHNIQARLSATRSCRCFFSLCCWCMCWGLSHFGRSQLKIDMCPDSCTTIKKWKLIRYKFVWFVGGREKTNATCDDCEKRATTWAWPSTWLDCMSTRWRDQISSQTYFFPTEYAKKLKLSSLSFRKNLSA